MAPEAEDHDEGAMKGIVPYILLWAAVRGVARIEGLPEGS